jgi:hypothetical protein
MRSIVKFTILFDLFICSLCFGLSIADVKNKDLELPRPKVKVTVDSRIELLAVVQFLSDYDRRYRLITRFDIPYKQDVRNHFSKYKSHPAVKFFDQMSAEDFSYDAPPSAMLYLSEPPELTAELPFTAYLNGRAGGVKRLNRFVELLRDFAEETEFMEFFKAHNETFQQMVTNAQMKMGSIDYLQTLEDYYGMRQNSYNIILAPLFVGGFGPRVERSDGKYDIYSILGLMNIEDGQPAFGSESSFRYIVWHEFSHSFVNPTTAKFSKEIDQYKALFEPISGRMSGQAYDNWQTCVNEHFVRAVTIRLTRREIGFAAGERALYSEKDRGFSYVQALCNSLAGYEEQRDLYPTFVDFYPELVKVFRVLSEKGLGQDFYSVPFEGTINAVVADRTSVVLVVPTNEKDKQVQKKIHSFVENIRKRFYKDIPILMDKEALKKDLSENSVVAYGTTDGNLFIAKHITAMPIRVEYNKVVAEKVYNGTNLRFISAWPNPSNPGKGMVFYTAQRPEDVLNINSIFHGPTDYVIARGAKNLKSGDYIKKTGTWSLSTVVDTGAEKERTSKPNLN